MNRREPLNCGLDLATVRCAAADGLGIMGGMHFRDLAVGVLHGTRAHDQGRVPQADFVAVLEAMECGRRLQALIECVG